MRVQVLSDLHLEFGPYEEGFPEADVVVLAGDISTGSRGLEWIRTRQPHARVIYVPGNHEYYGGAIPKLTDDLRRRGGELGIDVLEREAVLVGDLRFLGCTLWTDFQLHGPQSPAVAVAGQLMNDYRRIRVSPRYRRLRPQDTAAMHGGTKHWLEAEVDSGRTEGAIIVSHHAPSFRSLPSRLRQDPASCAYASHLDELVERCGALLWIHGHTHYCVDYRIGETRVLSNQRGYIDEPVAAFTPDLVVTIAAE